MMPNFRTSPICLFAVACVVSVPGLSLLAQQQLAAGGSPITQGQSQSKPVPLTRRVPGQQRTLRQIGMVDIPGSPGFDALAIANGKVLLAHTAASSLDVVDPSKRRVVAQVINLRSP